MIDRDPGASDILRRSFEFLRRERRNSAIALLVLAALGVAADLSEHLAPLLGLVVSIASLCFQYGITKSLLGALGLVHGGTSRRGLMPMIGLQIVSTIAIALGLVLLLIPGIYLFLRFFAATPILLAEDVGIIGALRRSWDETAHRLTAILGAAAIIYLPIIGVGSFVFGLTAEGEFEPFLSILFNLFLYAASIIGWYAAVAIYATPERREMLTEVFA